MIFEVTPYHIENLNDKDLRTLVGRLAEQHAVAAGASPSGITYGGHQNAPDGGIDVRADLGNTETNGYIPRAQTGFQVKAEDRARASILEEMKPKGALRSSIIELARAKGAYIIVSSKGSLSDTSLANRISAMREALEDDPDAKTLHVDFYDRQRLASWVNQNPGLVTWVRSQVGIPLSGWRPFEDWSSSPGEISETYFTDDQTRLVGARLKDSEGLDIIAGIELIRSILNSPKGSVRLVGLSGVGKTRLVQALFDKALGRNSLQPSTAIYTDIANSPSPPPLELMHHLQTLGQRCVLIVDNCGIELHRKLTARMATGGDEVSLITIEYDISDDEPENTDTFKLEPTSAELIAKIVKRRFPNLTSPELDIIAAFSEGNSRVALALANSSQYGGSLANLKDSELVERLFFQRGEKDTALMKAAKAMSLVYSFDGETFEGEDAELPLIAALTNQSNDDVFAHVSHLHRRQLIQKRSKWRALLPHALAHRLAKEALQEIPISKIKTNLINNAPIRLLKSFSKRLGCLHDFAEAKELVEEWIAADGMLHNIYELNADGFAILENVAPVAPQGVLRIIEASLKHAPQAFQRNLPPQRICSLLRLLAYEPETFDHSVTLLSAIASIEKPSNNTASARLIFKSLFFIRLSGTHASAKQRADFLRVLADSNIELRKELVMEGLEAMLECTHFTSSYSFEFGARKRDYGFNPKTWAEQFDWYKQAFLLAKDLSSIPEYKTLTRSKIAAKFKYLAAHSGPAEPLIDLAVYLADHGGWPGGWAGTQAAAREAKERGQIEDAEKYQALANKLKPGSLHDRIITYVLVDHWDLMDVTETSKKDGERVADALEKINAICTHIGEELASQTETLFEHLPSFYASNSNKILTVAKEVGRKTDDIELVWNAIVCALVSPDTEVNNLALPCGFLAGLADANRPAAEHLLDNALENEALHPNLMNFQSVVGLDEKGVERVVIASNLETVPSHTFRALGYGRATDGLSSSAFREMMRAVISRDTAYDSAVHVVKMRLFSRNSDNSPLDSDEQEIGRYLLQKLKLTKNSKTEDYTLSEIARMCMRPELDADLAISICEKLLTSLSDYTISGFDFASFIGTISKLFPREVLDTLLEGASGTMEGRRSLFGSFSDHRVCPIQLMPEQEVLAWAKAAPEKRCIQLAEAMRPWRPLAPKQSQPHAIENDTHYIEWLPVVLELMKTAPNTKEVVEEFVYSLRPSGWSGSLADILENRLHLIEQLCTDENTKLSDAAKPALDAFKGWIAREREREAQESRKRDERFEW